MEINKIGRIVAKETNTRTAKWDCKNLTNVSPYAEIDEIWLPELKAKYVNSFIKNQNIQVLFIDVNLGTDYSGIDQSRTAVYPMRNIA